jgi:hypothetical protein
MTSDSTPSHLSHAAVETEARTVAGGAPLHVLFVAGARPGFMKIAPLFGACEKRPDVATTLVHTGQPYDEELSEVFSRRITKIPAGSWQQATAREPIEQPAVGSRSASSARLPAGGCSS